MLLVMMLAMTSVFPVVAQQNAEEERGSRRTEMSQKYAERLADDLKLKDASKAAFLKTFQQYQAELQTVGRNTRADELAERKSDKKEVTDAEATAQIKNSFARQEQTIKQMQQRLEIQKKYYAEFSKTLTPQQLKKIFVQSRRPMQMGQRGQSMGGQRGGFNRGGMRGPGGDFGGGGFERNF